MTSFANLEGLSLRRIAIITGISIVVMGIMAGVTMGSVFSELFAQEDALKLFQTIQSSEQAFRLGIAGWLVIFISDVIASWGLYLYFVSDNKAISLLTAWMRLIYAALLGVAIVSLVNILPLIDSVTSGETDALSQMAFLYIKGFEEVWSFGLIIFGLHLMGVGYLFKRSGWLPQLLRLFLILGGLGYLIIHLGHLLLPRFDHYQSTLEAIFMLPMVVGEVGLAIWLIAKGGKQ